MEQEKKGSIFGTVLVVLILIGLVVYYLVNKNKMANIPETQNESQVQNGQTNENTTQTVSGEAMLETEVENLDTEFSDMNSEDLDM